MRAWALPEYIEDILPTDAACIERLRRRILDLFRTHGYQLLMPPLLEYVESLLTGTGHDLHLKTFKLVDRLSGHLAATASLRSAMANGFSAGWKNEPQRRKGAKCPPSGA